MITGRPRFQIPQDWDVDQVEVIWDFLDELNSAIWETHEEKIIEAMHKKYSMPERSVRGENLENLSAEVHVEHRKLFNSDDDFPF